MTGRVLVSGAAGFIGGYVVAELLARGYQVVGVDNLSKYGVLRPAHADHPGYRFVRGDAADPALLTELLGDCDHFIAGAAMVGGISYFHAYPYDLLAANERLTAAACDAAIAAHRSGRLRKVTYLSSSMVYESADSWPSQEGQQLRMPPPATAYGFSRLSVEYFARAAWEQYRLPFTILRPFNCVGVGETRPERDGGIGTGELGLVTGHVVPDLVCKVLKGGPLHILGTGAQLRHYTDGGDLARGIVIAMEHPAAENEDFNLSADRGTTVLELAAMIWRKIYGPDAPLLIVRDQPFPGDVQCRVPDTGKARRMLGFSADTPLEQTLDRVIAWVTDAIDAGLM
ncbi:MAG TPA: NAD-dependent epimerase/dehydratase family protein [Streptosporangiaceae bacterium]|nr:NAD-dependent epimerase/dehydratase family protein [Streptosporangiaceae bacterium]